MELVESAIAEAAHTTRLRRSGRPEGTGRSDGCELQRLPRGAVLANSELAPRWPNAVLPEKRVPGCTWKQLKGNFGSESAGRCTGRAHPVSMRRDALLGMISGLSAARRAKIPRTRAIEGLARNLRQLASSSSAPALLSAP